MLRIGAFVSGGGTNLQAVLDEIDKGQINASVIGVLSSSPSAYALERARVRGIDAACIRKKDYITDEEYDEARLRFFKEREADLIILAGYLGILGGSFINEYEGKIINIHPSLIPAFCGKGYYGIKVHEAALARGVKVTGATVHFVDKGTDTGPIIFQKAVEVHEGDTPETLQRRVMEEAEWDIFTKAIKLYCDGKIRMK